MAASAQDLGPLTSLPYPHRFHHLHPGTHCRQRLHWNDPFTMAFQPIVDTRQLRVVAYEALARGVNDEPASSVLRMLSAGEDDDLDQRCRVKAIELAAMLGLAATGADLCINFLPNAMYETEENLYKTVRAAEEAGLPLSRLIFELNEMEPLHSSERMNDLVRQYRALGIRTAMDDFGSGLAGLSMLAAYQPDIVKLDIALTRKIHERKASRTIVRAVVGICGELGIEVVAEGVEEREEQIALEDLGIFKMQGFYLARPMFEGLPMWNG